MFGMAYHSITCHFPEWYRLLSLRSINAENQERFFKDIKSTTRSTNFQHDHIVLNSLIRLQVKAESTEQAKSFHLQEGKIAREWQRLSPCSGTIITKKKADENIAAFAAHRMRIADFLLEGVWHEEDECGNHIFFDGEHDLQQRVPSHYKHQVCKWEQI